MLRSKKSFFKSSLPENGILISLYPLRKKYLKSLVFLLARFVMLLQNWKMQESLLDVKVLEPLSGTIKKQDFGIDSKKFIRKDGRLPVFDSKPSQLEIIPAPDDIAKKMKIIPGDPVIHCLRDMSENGEHVGVDESFLDLETFQDLKMEDFEEVKGNLYKLYEEKLGVYIADVTDILEFAIIDEELHKKSKLPIGSPLFFVTRQGRLLNKKTVEIRYEYCSAVNYRLCI